MERLCVTLSVKRKSWFVILFNLTMFIHSIRLIKNNHVLNIVNLALSIGAFKYKVNNGKWSNLKINKKLGFAE